MKQISVPQNTPTDFLWGADAIALYLNLDRHQVYYLVRKNRLPVKKLGRRTFMARKSELDAAMSASEG